MNNFIRDHFSESSSCGSLEDPPNEVVIISADDVTPDAADDFVQLSPQRVRLRLRAGEEMNFSFLVAQVCIPAKTHSILTAKQILFGILKNF